MRALLPLLSAAVLLSACAAAPVAAADGAPGPVEAIQGAARVPSGVGGVFEMRVKTTGRAEGNIYLNSEDDYRDQLNLSVALLPTSVSALRVRYGHDLEAALRGRRIRVEGVARRVRIDFVAGGRLTDKFYYQTHIDVTDARQLSVVPDGPT